MSNEDVQFSVGAEDTGVQAALDKVQESVAEAVESMKGNLETLNESFEKVQGMFVAFTAALAGGEAFKEAVSSTANLNRESMALGKQFGMSASDASVLKVALGSVNVTQDTFSAAAGKIDLALQKNESNFTDLGVATRDSNGNFRSTKDIMMDVNARLMEFKEGTDRNVEGIKIYGRSFLELASILKLTDEATKEATVKSQALGLYVGNESVAATKAYTAAMNETHEVMEGLENQIGSAVMPVLTELGEWFGDHGPEVINAFKAAIFTVKAVFIDVVAAVQVDIDLLKGGFNILVAEVVGDFKTIKAAMTPGESAAAAWAERNAAVAASTKTMTDEIKKDLADAAKATDEARDATQNYQTEIAKPKPGKGSNGGDDRLKSKMAEFEAELEAEKATYSEEQREQGSFIEFSKQAEIDFWQEKLGTVKKGSADALKIGMDINKLRLASDKEAYEGELAGIKSQEAQYKNNLEAKLALAVEYANKIAVAEGADNPKAKQAQEAVLAIDREIDAQRLAIAKTTRVAMDNLELSAIDAAQKSAEVRVANHLETDAQLIAQERNFEAQRLAIKQQGINADIAAAQIDIDKNPQLLAQLNAQKLELQVQYQQKIAALNLKAANDSAKDWKQTFSQLTSGFQNVISGMLQGTMSFSQAVQSMYKSIANVVADTAAKMLTDWLEKSVQQLLGSKTDATQQIGDNAAVAGSAAVASTAAIPIFGPELAPEAGALAYAAALGYGASLSAAGGYDVPGGVNPVVQTHQREMILPQEHADTIRGLKNSGSGSNTFNINAIDSASVKSLLMNNRSAVYQAVKKHMRGTGQSTYK